MSIQINRITKNLCLQKDPNQPSLARRLTENIENLQFVKQKIKTYHISAIKLRNGNKYLKKCIDNCS